MTRPDNFGSLVSFLDPARFLLLGPWPHFSRSGKKFVTFSDILEMLSVFLDRACFFVSAEIFVGEFGQMSQRVRNVYSHGGVNI